jgi:hypothetical protein
MNTDRELLELAAKAAGIRFDGFDEDRGVDIWWLPDLSRYDKWNPLDDDGDALRLAVKLRLSTKDFRPVDAPDLKVPGMIEVWDGDEDTENPVETYWYQIGDDRLAATRRAIVRAAAEIGRSMK